MRVARAAAAAVAFLTIVPLGRVIVLGPDDVARGAALFPLVGAAVGAAMGGVATGLAGPLPPLAAAALALAAGAVLTGAMHLDALADSADALGARSRAAALEIMRDPRIGPFGVLALTLDVLTKAVALAALTAAGGAVLPAIAAGAAARATAPVLAVALPAARADGSGAELARRGGLGVAATAAAIGLVVAAVASGWAGVAIFATAALVAGGVAVAARRRFGGATGDVLGAAVELAETAGLLVAVALG
ncbi:MAG TPA: adenosylcobinamide-GDP ribazoletransferase [Gaiellaceae bacterium]|nr:adenosylcobinamide-GDP ribazoletransferase [Gaiellaceae bacterium]